MKKELNTIKAIIIKKSNEIFKEAKEIYELIKEIPEIKEKIKEKKKEEILFSFKSKNGNEFLIKIKTQEEPENKKIFVAGTGWVNAKDK